MSGRWSLEGEGGRKIEEGGRFQEEGKARKSMVERER